MRAHIYLTVLLVCTHTYLVQSAMADTKPRVVFACTPETASTYEGEVTITVERIVSQNLTKNYMETWTDNIYLNPKDGNRVQVGCITEEVSTTNFPGHESRRYLEADFVMAGKGNGFHREKVAFLIRIGKEIYFYTFPYKPNNGDKRFDGNRVCISVSRKDYDSEGDYSWKAMMLPSNQDGEYFEIMVQRTNKNTSKTYWDIYTVGCTDKEKLDCKYITEKF